MTEQIKPVAEVVLYDPIAAIPELEPLTPYKIIDASFAFMISAKLGDKLYSAETVQQLQERNDRLLAALKEARSQIYHWATQEKAHPENKWLKRDLADIESVIGGGSYSTPNPLDEALNSGDGVYRP